MPEIGRSEDTDDSSCDLVRFGTSPVMSTYLVAIVVGEFDYIEDKSEEGITCRVYSPLGKKEQGRSERQELNIAIMNKTTKQMTRSFCRKTIYMYFNMILNVQVCPGVCSEVTDILL